MVAADCRVVDDGGADDGDAAANPDAEGVYRAVVSRCRMAGEPVRGACGPECGAATETCASRRARIGLVGGDDIGGASLLRSLLSRPSRGLSVRVPVFATKTPPPIPMPLSPPLPPLPPTALPPNPPPRSSTPPEATFPPLPATAIPPPAPLPPTAPVA